MKLDKICKMLSKGPDLYQVISKPYLLLLLLLLLLFFLLIEAEEQQPDCL